jgi:hypothetical protein
MDKMIYPVLCFAAGTWLNGGLQEKYLRTLKALLNSTLQIVFGKRRQEYSTLKLPSLANMQTSSQMAGYHPGFFSKSSGCVHPCNDPSILQRKKQFTRSFSAHRDFQKNFNIQEKIACCNSHKIPIIFQV